jgi:hypothetical protein
MPSTWPAAFAAALLASAGCTPTESDRAQRAPASPLPAVASPAASTTPKSVPASTPAPSPKQPAARIAPLFAVEETPIGYGPAVVSAEPGGARQTVQYFPEDESRRGERISVVTTTRPMRTLMGDGAYRVLATTTVRGGKQATYFAVSDDPRTRHGLAWEERPQVFVAVYAFDEMPRLREVADNLVAADPK